MIENISDFTELFRVAVEIYTIIIQYAAPFAFAFGIGNVIVNTFFSVAFGGRLKIGGK